MEYPTIIKRVIPVLLLVLFWCWQTWRPYFDHQRQRWLHAGRNLGIAVVNTLVMGFLFGSLTVLAAEWTETMQYGLLHLIYLPAFIQFLAALLILDAWMYVWHRANHAVPLLWRFHRMHHSDRHMDVTTATRFHLGELAGAAVARLALIPLVGFNLWHLLVYDMLLIAVTQFHHANISLGAWDRWLRLVIVTPDMHKVHHSDRQAETDANFSTVLSVWDRLARTLRTRPNPRTIQFGLREFTDPAWQTFWGLWKTPFVDPSAKAIRVDRRTPIRENAHSQRHLVP